jgi:hypothetical protein
MGSSQLSRCMRGYRTAGREEKIQGFNPGGGKSTNWTVYYRSRSVDGLLGAFLKGGGRKSGGDGGSKNNQFDFRRI